jgi:hypothetical protein
MTITTGITRTSRLTDCGRTLHVLVADDRAARRRSGRDGVYAQWVMSRDLDLLSRPRLDRKA